MTDKDEFLESTSILAKQYDADILLYNGEIERPWDQRLIDLCKKRSKHKNVILFLITQGGNPDAAFRIARCLQRNYNKFYIIISGYCKSAGTIVAIGADEVLFFDSGELGPLDVQLVKKDELFESSSGLNINDALESLQERTLKSLEDYFLKLNIKSGGRISTKTATQIAKDVVVGLYGQIFHQIDPMYIGETSRAMKIAIHYGKLLNNKSQNLKDKALERLANDYPSHSFVIDFKEAKELFKNIKELSENEAKIINCIGQAAIFPGGDVRNGEPLIVFLNKELPKRRAKNVAKNGASRNSQVRKRNTKAPASAQRSTNR